MPLDHTEQPAEIEDTEEAQWEIVEYQILESLVDTNGRIARMVAEGRDVSVCRDLAYTVGYALKRLKVAAQVEQDALLSIANNVAAVVASIDGKPCNEVSWPEDESEDEEDDAEEPDA
jgi:hypothetical protein